MVGRSIASVRLNEPCQWAFMFESGAGIGAECPWRLLRGGRVAISSEDHLQQYGLQAPLDAAIVATEMLSSRAVARVEVRYGTSDLFIEFTDEVLLEIVPFSSGYESWGVTSPSGFKVIAQGGGQLCGWQS